MNVTRNELMSRFRDRFDTTWEEARLAVNGVFGVVEDALINNDVVNVTKFGKFTPRVRPARKGRNLQTGESMDVASKRTVTFRAGKTLKVSLNS